MKQFNQTITVEVSVDSIAQDLLNTMSPDAKHREIITEAVIATALQKDTLGYIYNALNGHLPYINFNVGDEVMCSASFYIGGERIPIGQATVLEVNPYSSEQLYISYGYFDSDGKPREGKRWVGMQYCDRKPAPINQVVL
jgi:hypothetical protein